MDLLLTLHTLMNTSEMLKMDRIILNTACEINQKNNYTSTLSLVVAHCKIVGFGIKPHST
jgi:hypothetical protein